MSKSMKQPATIAVLLVVLGLVGFLIFSSTSSDSDETTNLIGSTPSDNEVYEDASDYISEAGEHINNGDTALAADAAKQAVEADPASINVLLPAAEIIELHSVAESREYYERALRLYESLEGAEQDGRSAAVYEGAGSIAEKAGLAEEAIAYYETAIAADDPESADDDPAIVLARQGLERLQ